MGLVGNWFGVVLKLYVLLGVISLAIEVRIESSPSSTAKALLYFPTDFLSGVSSERDGSFLVVANLDVVYMPIDILSGVFIKLKSAFFVLG